MSRYQAGPDPYCYAASTVLKNIPGIRVERDLSRFERLASLVRAGEALPRGRYGIAHYCAFHRHLFQDVFAWAGKFRTIGVIKGESRFCLPELIPTQMELLFGRLRRDNFLRGRNANEFATNGAHFLADLNAIHPFREGNGRAQTIFLAELAVRAGHPLALARLRPDAFLKAMIGSFFGDEVPLAQQIRDLIS